MMHNTERKGLHCLVRGPEVEGRVGERGSVCVPNAVMVVLFFAYSLLYNDRWGKCSWITYATQRAPLVHLKTLQPGV